MTSGHPPVGLSPLKLGGYALLGVGALAAALGVATMISGEVQESARGQTPGQPASPPSSSTAPNPPTPVRPQSLAPQPPVLRPPGHPPAGAPSSQEGQVGKPKGGNPHAPGRPGVPHAGDQAKPRIVVRVYNNSTIKGLAHRAAEDFREVGYEVPEVGNYAAGRIPTTTVYYRPRTPEEAQAKEVATHFQTRAEPRFEGLGPASSGVIVIVTSDYKGNPADK